VGEVLEPARAIFIKLKENPPRKQKQIETVDVRNTVYLLSPPQIIMLKKAEYTIISRNKNTVCSRMVILTYLLQNRI